MISNPDCVHWQVCVSLMIHGPSRNNLKLTYLAGYQEKALTQMQVLLMHAPCSLICDDAALQGDCSS